MKANHVRSESDGTWKARSFARPPMMGSHIENMVKSGVCTKKFHSQCIGC